MDLLLALFFSMLLSHRKFEHPSHGSFGFLMRKRNARRKGKERTRGSLQYVKEAARKAFLLANGGIQSRSNYLQLVMFCLSGFSSSNKTKLLLLTTNCSLFSLR